MGLEARWGRASASGLGRRGHQTRRAIHDGRRRRLTRPLLHPAISRCVGGKKPAILE